MIKAVLWLIVSAAWGYAFSSAINLWFLGGEKPYAGMEHFWMLIPFTLAVITYIILDRPGFKKSKVDSANGH